MKLFSIFGFCLLISVSCKKNKTAAIMPADVTGKWKWSATYYDIPLGPNNPLTPANSTNSGNIEYYSQTNWRRNINNTSFDSGKYSLVHEKYTNLSNAEFVFDKIIYTKNNTVVGFDWYEIHGDTLHICPCFGGSFTSFNITDNFGGSKKYIRQ